MAAFQEILGKKQAEQFSTSMNVLVGHLEARQRQLIAALQETSTTLEVFKRLGSADSASSIEPLTLTAIAQLEQAVVPQLQAIAGQAVQVAEVLPIAETAVAEPAAVVVPEAEETEIAEVDEPAPSGKRAKKTKTTAKGGAKSSAKASPAQKYSTFHPRRSVLKEFEGKTLREAIRIILTRRANEALSINDVMDELYGKTLSKESFKVAKSVVVVELSKGKLAKQWSSAPGQRGVYIFTTSDSDSDAQDD
ncbi:MAG TPA: hypothetical protein V6C88_14160 [Chroococcidiopsis sp.]